MNQRIRRPSNRSGNLNPSVPVAPPAPVPTPQERPKVGMHALKAFLESKKDAIARVLPPNLGITSDGLIQNALQQIMRDKRLMMCEQYSVLDSVLAAATVGLDLVADQAFLVAMEHKVKDENGEPRHAG